MIRKKNGVQEKKKGMEVEDLMIRKKMLVQIHLEEKKGNKEKDLMRRKKMLG